MELIPSLHHCIRRRTISCLAPVLVPLLKIHDLGSPSCICKKFIDYIIIVKPLWCRSNSHKISPIRSIQSLGKAEILKMLDEQVAEGKPRELTAVCRFCNTEYTYTEKDLIG